jgi:hypothetical protein
VERGPEVDGTDSDGSGIGDEALRGEEREGCAASSGESVRVHILGDVGSQFPTLGHQGSGSFQLVQYPVMSLTSYVMLYTLRNMIISLALNDWTLAPVSCNGWGLFFPCIFCRLTLEWTNIPS